MTESIFGDFKLTSGLTLLTIKFHSFWTMLSSVNSVICIALSIVRKSQEWSCQVVADNGRLKAQNPSLHLLVFSIEISTLYNSELNGSTMLNPPYPSIYEPAALKLRT